MLKKIMILSIALSLGLSQNAHAVKLPKVSESAKKKIEETSDVAKSIFFLSLGVWALGVSIGKMKDIGDNTPDNRIFEFGRKYFPKFADEGRKEFAKTVAGPLLAALV